MNCKKMKSELNRKMVKKIKRKKQEVFTSPKPSLHDLTQFFNSLQQNGFQNKNHISTFKFVKQICFQFYQHSDQNQTNDQTLSDDIITTATLEHYINLKPLLQESLFEQKDDEQMLKKLRAKLQVSEPRAFAKAIAARSFLKSDYGYHFYMQYIKKNDLKSILEPCYRSVKSYRHLTYSFMLHAFRSAEAYMMAKDKNIEKALNQTITKVVGYFLKRCRSHLEEQNCKTFLLLVVQNFKFAKVQFKSKQIQTLYFALQSFKNQVQKYFKDMPATKLMRRRIFNKSKHTQIINRSKSKLFIDNKSYNQNQTRAFWTKEIDEELVKQYLETKEIKELTRKMKQQFPDAEFDQSTVLFRLNDIQIQNLHAIEAMAKVEQNGLSPMVELTDKVIRIFKTLQLTSDIRLGLSYFKVNSNKNLVQNLILGFNYIVFQEQQQ